MWYYKVFFIHLLLLFCTFLDKTKQLSRHIFLGNPVFIINLTLCTIN